MLIWERVLHYNKEVHSVSDYKKRLYKKRLVDSMKCKKRRLVNFSKLRNVFLKRLSKFKIARNNSP